MAQLTLTARIRDVKGKGATRKLRRNNQIPAIFYGPDTNSIMLAVNYSDLERIIKQYASENIILGLQIESNQGSESKTVMLKELQIDPIKDIYLHADFYEVSMDREITVDVPVHLLNTPIGVTNGGILQHVRRELNISCLPGKLIEYIDVDVSHLDIGASIHIDDIDFPEGTKSNQEGRLTVAVVAAPTVIIEEEEEEVEEIEGEEVEGEGEGEGADTETQSVKEE